jgi:hypothetical protein
MLLPPGSDTQESDAVAWLHPETAPVPIVKAPVDIEGIALGEAIGIGAYHHTRKPRYLAAQRGDNITQERPVRQRDGHLPGGTYRVGNAVYPYVEAEHLNILTLEWDRVKIRGLNCFCPTPCL